jgi:hypothetical protein
MKEATTVDAAVGALRRAIADERRTEVREQSGAAYEVGFERGFLAGWEAAEREGERHEPAA